MRNNETIALENGEVLSERLRSLARPLRSAEDLEPLLAHIGDASYVLIGEASHGTSDFYRWRAQLSQRLIREKGFSFIAVEGDWPDCYQVNRFVKGYEDILESASDVLQTFGRWPTWMWANWEVVAFAEWLREHNEGLEQSRQVGFYGLDVYSLWESLEAVTDYLERNEPAALETVRRAFQCFQPYGEDVQAYAEATALVPTSCENEVVELLKALREQVEVYSQDGEARFNAEQNARSIVGAERYYRAMVRGGSESWNVRDRHMMETLERLMQQQGPEAKAIVWAHNTHIGDARATDMASAGMINIGELTREAHGSEDVVLVGFSSYQGSVIAGAHWDAPLETMPVPPATKGSWEALLHQAGSDRLLLTAALENEAFYERRNHRAIGVVYTPQLERRGNYVPSVLPERYDALLHLDETEALHPLQLDSEQGLEPPETYPWGL